MRIEHINVTVNDIDASAEFYCRLLGVERRWEGITEAGKRAVHVGDGDSYLSLFEAGSAGRAPADYLVVGFNHLCFEVTDLGRSRATLLDLGATIKGEEDYHPGRRLYFYDPDGNEVELVEY